MTLTTASREPLRPVVDTLPALAQCIDSLESGSGPVAWDAERAHGHRYWPKAYLFQVRREGSGTWLIDPLPFEHQPGALTELAKALGDAEWIIHSASQDLPCMRDAGVYPTRLFDTELAARLMGVPYVSLQALLSSRLGIDLKKAHSAANWATRPLPEDWLTYAALDVDYLPELRDILAAELDDMGRSTWAAAEFRDTLERCQTAEEPPDEPWRTLSGITSLKKPLQLAVARSLWQARDALARTKDRPPSKLLKDAAIVEAAQLVSSASPLPGPKQLRSLSGFTQRAAHRYLENWAQAISEVGKLKPKQLPSRYPTKQGLGHPRSWARKHPQASRAWDKVKPAIDELACELGVQASLVAPPAIVQSVVFHHHAEQDFARHLADQGAREWQIDFLAPLLQQALAGYSRSDI